ncbi:MAG: aminotransferase class V-fold PLP-dependent enzyme [Bacteroidota bacterium]
MLNCQKSRFRLPEDIVYLNGSYMSPNLDVVEAAGIEGVKQKSHPYLIKPNDFFAANDLARSLFAELINMNEPGRIVSIPSVSYAISNAANNIPFEAGDKIILTGEQFPSNVYPWMRVAQEKGASLIFVDPPDVKDKRAAKWNKNILEAIDTKTKVVAMAQAHWTDGTLFNLPAIRERTEAVNAYLVLDCTQTIGALPFDFAKIRPDVLAVAAYKWLLGPYSIGLAYFSDRFDQGIPLEENWMNRLNSEDFSALVNYQEKYQPMANRFEVGEKSNFTLIPMLLAALEQLNSWTPEAIQDYCCKLSFPFAEKFREYGCWVEEDQYRCGHLFGIRLPENLDLEKLKTKISSSNIFVSYRGSSIRVSPNVYNTKSDMQKLLDCFN